MYSCNWRAAACLPHTRDIVSGMRNMHEENCLDFCHRVISGTFTRFPFAILHSKHIDTSTHRHINFTFCSIGWLVVRSLVVESLCSAFIGNAFDNISAFIVSINSICFAWIRTLFINRFLGAGHTPLSAQQFHEWKLLPHSSEYGWRSLFVFIFFSAPCRIDAINILCF